MKKKNDNTDNSENLNAPAQEKKRRKKRKKAPIIIAAILIIFLVWRLVACSTAGTAAAVVTTTTPIVGDLQESISTSGSVQSEEKKVYFAPVAGVLGEVKVAAGDSVKAGETLVSYDEEAVERQYKEATLQQTISDSTYKEAMAGSSKSQAKLNEANTNLAVLEQQISDHEAYLESLQQKLSQNQRDTSNALAEESFNLSQRSAALQQELNALEEGTEAYSQKAAELAEVSAAQSRNSYLQQVASSSSSDYAVNMQKEIDSVTKNLSKMKEYKAEMESQKASNENGVLDSNQRAKYEADSEIAALSFQQAEEDYYTAKQGITAEFDGIVTECAAVEGATVPEGTQLLTLENSGQVKVVFSASKYDLEKLEVGQNAQVTISGSVYEGSISKIDRMARTNESGTPMVGVEIHLNHPDDKIILGLDAKIEIYTHKTENALLVPVEAINADKEGDFLYVVENGIAVRKPVVCGLSSDTYTEILEGITETEQIILTSYTALEEGMPVMAMPEGMTGMAADGQGTEEDGTETSASAAE